MLGVGVRGEVDFRRVVRGNLGVMEMFCVWIVVVMITTTCLRRFVGRIIKGGIFLYVKSLKKEIIV